MSTARLPEDFADLIRCLGEAGAEYMLVGGYAVMAHGHVRATSDLDVWVRPTRDNAARVMTAMREFGLPPGLSLEGLLEPRSPAPTGFRFGRPPLAVDLLTSIQGVEFDDAWRESELRRIDDLEIRVIGRKSLIANKLSTGRTKDAADVEALQALENNS